MLLSLSYRKPLRRWPPGHTPSVSACIPRPPTTVFDLSHVPRSGNSGSALIHRRNFNYPEGLLFSYRPTGELIRFSWELQVTYTRVLETNSLSNQIKGLRLHRTKHPEYTASSSPLETILTLQQLMEVNTVVARMYDSNISLALNLH